MPGGFGFVKPPQRPAPDPREVGVALMRQGRGGMMGGGMAPMAPGARPALDADADTDLPPDRDADDTHGLEAAQADAVTRLRGGSRPTMDPRIDRARRAKDVTRLGMSPFEAMLLSRTGGL